MTESISAALTARLPSTWTSAPLGMVAQIINGGTPTADEMYWNGEVPFVTPPDLRGVDGAQVGPTGRTLTFEGVSAGSTLVDGGIVVSSRAPIGYVGRLAQPSAFNQGCKVVRPASADERFLAYVLIATRPVMQKLGQGTTFMELSADALGTLRVPLPSVIEQQRIADYLDHETATMDTLIEKQRVLVSVLAERKTAMIANAISDDPDDGSHWWGQLKGGWRAGRVSRVGTVVLGKMLQSRDSDSAVLRPYLRAANVQPGGEIVLDSVREMWFSPTEVELLTLEAGDVVVVEGGQGGFGRAAFLVTGLEGWGYQNSINRVRMLHGHDGRFLTYVLLLARSTGYLRSITNIVSMPHFTAEKLAAMIVPIPPLDEQRRIANHLDEETTKIDALIAKAERFIELAQERRAALITAAVTGQISVD